MNFKQAPVTLENTHAFSKLILHYTNQHSSLKHLISNFPSEEAISAQIDKKRKNFSNREAIHKCISNQYQGLELGAEVAHNMKALLSENTFTICTAHQPSIFTGQLYFIYKIAHAVTLAQHCKKWFPSLHFVPIYYMGSEDDDMEEIGSFFYNGKNYKWQPEELEMSGRLSLKTIQEILKEVLTTLNPNHTEEAHLMDVLQNAYQASNTLSQATRILINHLFGEYGLIVIDGDDIGLKTIFSPIIQKEIEAPFSQHSISNTLEFLSSNYHVQAAGRNVNLFYIKDHKRDRIERKGDNYVLAKSNIEYTKAALLEEATHHPERFSSNVILRPLYQEMILPNVAFIGGGGEIAYWLQLKSIFDASAVPYPVLILRNSFLVIDKKNASRFNKLNLIVSSLFESSTQHKKSIINADPRLEKLTSLFKDANEILHKTTDLANELDTNLIKSVDAHLTKIKRIQKRLEEKFAAQIRKQYDWEHDTYLIIKSHLFPNNQLQERHDNFLTLYKLYHSYFIKYLIENGQALGASFTVLMEEE